MQYLLREAQPRRAPCIATCKHRVLGDACIDSPFGWVDVDLNCR